MKTKQLFYLGVMTIAIAFTSCNKDNPSPSSSGGTGIYSNGVFVMNQGQFSSGSGTVSFYSRDNGKLYTDIFQTRNGYPLGSIVQSMQIFNNKGYIVVNNDSKVQVVNYTTFGSIGEITGLTNPRYFIGINNTTGYVSQWGSGVTGAVKVVNLNTNTVTATINTGNGAEQMVQVGNFVYVACSGGYVNDSVVTVINTANNSVVTNINAGANPTSMQVDGNGYIWVICGGTWNASYTAQVIPGSIARINPQTNTVDFSLPFPSTIFQMPFMVINTTLTTLYYLYNGAVYQQSTAASALNTTPIINRDFNSIGMDPTNNYFYCANAGNYVSNGTIIRYNTTGIVVDSFAAGVIPGNFCFK